MLNNLPNPLDTPTLTKPGAVKRARQTVIRTAIIWTPCFLACVGAAIFVLVDILTSGGSWVGFSLASFFAIVFGFQGIHAIRDLVGGPVQSEGTVIRHWTRRDALVSKTHYIRLSGKEILHVDPTQHLEIKTGDYLHVEFYPGTMRALRIEKGDAPEIENIEQDKNDNDANTLDSTSTQNIPKKKRSKKPLPDLFTDS